MPVSADERREILKLLDEGLMSPEIAQKLGVPDYTVRGIKSWYTKARDRTDEDDVLAMEAIEATFGFLTRPSTRAPEKYRAA